MRFTILTAALISAATALPSSPSNFLAPVQNIPPTPPVDDNAAPFAIAASEKRDLAKRATLIVDVYLDLDGTGRHEGLYTDTQRCYNLGNGWPDEITSLKVPNGFGCVFYRDTNCNNNDNRLTVPGGNFVRDLRVYNMDDKISSYLCYQ
ncbi:hypothetical protein CC86DRAFT_460450 [Ophiobolus disseminans]|uniref:Beta/gamma crystallin 'Greek key' domain-containing protein n=1 Tax=Ophiobolus disseminans TaxID=1469910 RepID=A0A6A6ZF09_9PLEO|nr:hypothetical protein CC86DRAFT_460450 [Ophiobolus disseminans]